MNYAKTFGAYAEWAKTKEKPGLDRNFRVDHGIIGLAGELGEFLDAIKKNWIYEQPLNVKHIAEELGDCLFYLALLANTSIEGNELHPVLVYESQDVLDTALDALDALDTLRVRLRATQRTQSSLNHILACIQWLAHEYSLTLPDLYTANQKKLEVRYPNGYSNEAAALRADKQGDSNA